MRKTFVTLHALILTIVTMVSLGATTAFAETVYDVFPANVDPNYYDGSGGHALWLPGIGTDFIFTNFNPGQFTMKDDGTASLTGIVEQKSNTNNMFEVDVNLNGFVGSGPTPNGSPHKELKQIAYSEDGGPVDTNTWVYYTDYSGTLTGLGNYAGGIVNIWRNGPAFQVGEGANGKNLNFGASGWNNWEVVSDPTQGSFGENYGRGDFNLDLQPIPEPSTMILLASGLAGMIGWRMRRGQVQTTP